MQVKVHAQPKAEPRSPGQEPSRQIERNSVDVRPAKLAETIIRQALEGQRCQKVLAELPVAGPWLSLAIDLERQRIDKDRPPLLELKVVNAAVFEGHPAQDCPTLDLEGNQRGILELAEAPFIRVRNEFDPLGSNHLVGLRRVQRFGFDLFVLDQEPLVGQLTIKPGGQEMVIMRAVDLVHLSAQIRPAGNRQTPPGRGTRLRRENGPSRLLVSGQ